MGRRREFAGHGVWRGQSLRPPAQPLRGRRLVGGLAGAVVGDRVGLYGVQALAVGQVAANSSRAKARSAPVTDPPPVVLIETAASVVVRSRTGRSASSGL